MGDPPAPVRVVLGLGNPGVTYARSRHNAGFLVVDRLRHEAGVLWRERRDREEASVHLGGFEVLLARPTTFMNHSGWAAARIAADRMVPPSGFLVVSDDIALPLGRLRFRLSGSAGGHNGLLSVTEQFGTTEFPRLRVGVGAPPPGREAADFVLEPLAEGDWEALSRVIERAAEGVRVACAEGLGTAMNRFNPAPPEGGAEPEPGQTGEDCGRKDEDDA